MEEAHTGLTPPVHSYLEAAGLYVCLTIECGRVFIAACGVFYRDPGVVILGACGVAYGLVQTYRALALWWRQK